MIIDKIRNIKLSRLSPVEKYILELLEDSYTIHHTLHSDYLIFYSKTEKNRYGNDKVYFSLSNYWMRLYVAQQNWNYLSYKYGIDTFDDIVEIIMKIFTMYTGIKIKEVFMSSNI